MYPNESADLEGQHSRAKLVEDTKTKVGLCKKEHITTKVHIHHTHHFEINIEHYQH